LTAAPNPSPLPLCELHLISPSPGEPLPTESRFMNSCIQARRKCQANPTCKAAYDHLGSCTTSLNTLLPSEEPAVPAECLEAVQQLKNSSLIGCTCHRRMKHQTACLDIYWTVHPARSLLFSNFAMLGLLNEKLVRGPAANASLCLEQLRAFFEKAAEPHAQGLLLCPCAPTDLGCGERRRNTIAPSCALPRVASNCLELRRLCLSDPLCRSRLADFQTHCHPMDILGTCATEQSRCLRAYLGLIGTAMTPNFVSNVNTSVALSCTCRGSGNLQEECERLEASFSHNPCLTKAMTAKMRFHSQFFSQNGADSTFSVMEHQNQSPALRPQPWVPLLFSCTLILILLLSLW
uniref:GDNF family receptor alpha-3 n=1 Tax=Oryctolagus cuniculus TaxID=9986 RepID=A0A5F9CSQ4_RABIT